MRVKIQKIIEPGVIENERVVIRCDADEDIGEYVVLRVGVAGDGVNSSVTRTFWFPDKEVAKGDYVVLYSKPGVYKSREKTNYTYHFFYWGSEQPLWDDTEKAVVLMHAPDWESFRVQQPNL